GFPVEGNESDSVARHNGAVVATGFIERITLFSAESGRSQYQGKTIRFLPFHPLLLSPRVQAWGQLSTSSRILRAWFSGFFGVEKTRIMHPPRREGGVREGLSPPGQCQTDVNRAAG